MSQLVRTLAFAIIICATAYGKSHAVPIAPLTEYYSGVLASLLVSPLVSPLRGMVLPASLLGLALGLVAVTRRFLCTIGSAFRHPIPFRNPRCLVKRFVSAPFLFAGRNVLTARTLAGLLLRGSYNGCNVM